MIKKIYLAIVMPLLVVLAACGHHSEPAPPPEPVVASRTVLVYMVASNSLGTRYDNADLVEMEQAAREGQLGQGRLLVYHVPFTGAPVLKEVTAAGIDTLKTYEAGTVSVTIDQMRRVFADTKEAAPAHDYGLVLWSHATGWLQDGIVDEPAEAKSYGIDNKKKMNITSLAQALEGQDFSFVYFDCCYMGSVEVMYELRRCSPYIVGMPTEDPINGMPYHRTLSALFAEGNADLPEAARRTVEYYAETYAKNDCPVTVGVIDTSALDDLAAATRAIYQAADSPMPDGYYPQKFSAPMGTGECYYFDYADYVRALCADDALRDDFDQALGRAVVYKNNLPWIWGEIEIRTFSGLSTYILRTPSHVSNKNYDTLSWYADVASALVN